MADEAQATRYSKIIERVFHNSYSQGATSLGFSRTDIEGAAAALGIVLPKNLGDVIYSFRYRTPLPDSIRRTAPDGEEWAIVGAGKGRYRFACVPFTSIEPDLKLVETTIPDATPGLIEMYALSDEQALLAKLRYNRLIDIFSGLTCYSLQNHLRTTVPGLGQVETDEVYLGLDRAGSHFVLPVQAKGGSDKLSTVQISQDFALCSHVFRGLAALPIATQFLDNDLIALFSFELQDGHPVVREERHYRMTASDLPTQQELLNPTRRTGTRSR